jgi:Do/DeqQ family serine protease
MPQPTAPVAVGPDFVKASQVARPCVVYIKVLLAEGEQESPFQGMWDPFGWFGNSGPVAASGSGVIISPDGYIVTNSHVVKGATQIEVVMNNNKRSFTGKVIGIDASSDLALIKIESSGLPFISFANSDELPIGEWVMAVGNPFNLTSTVTAGIVSAKGRNINLVQNQFPIESFIQTDAAINPGNSGGALVNVDGKLVGINTAILSKTGSYAGYGFAIPSNIVKKVINDIKEFGYVQRGFVEADVIDIDDALLKKINDNDANVNGVYARYVVEGGNGDRAGLKKGDIIIKVNDVDVYTKSNYDEQLAYHRPGDKVKLTVKRGKEIKEVTVTLTNLQGNTSLSSEHNAVHSKTLGADFEPLSKLEKEKYHVTNGIRVTNITSGPIRSYNLQDGFIITGFNGKEYSDPNDLINAMENAGNQISIQGIDQNGNRQNFSFYRY